MNDRRLKRLRAHLARFGRRRRMIRIACGALALALTLAGLLVPMFLADWGFRFSRLERALLLLGLAGSLAWAYTRWLHRALRQHESETDLALQWNQRTAQGGDLVAALQFDGADSGRFGSSALRQAVIERVAAIRAFPAAAPDPAAGRLRRLTWIGIATLAGVFVVTALLPGELRAFADRLLLGRARYPTRTVIVAVRINGRPLEINPARPAPLKAPYGQPLRFEVDYRGAAPQDGTLLVANLENERPVTVVLTAQAGSQIFAGEIDRLLEPISFRVRLGDDETEPAVIEPIPLPAVVLELSVTPPDYAARRRPAATIRGVRQVSVLEGSRIDLRLESTNKPLRSANLRVAGREWPLAPQDAKRRVWHITGDSTPLERVLEPGQFEVLALDDDGLGPEEPLRCAISLEPDHPPRVAAAIVTEKVLPIAEPTVAWGVTDDYGVGEIRLAWRIIHPGGETEQSAQVLRPRVARGAPPAAVRGRDVWSLAPLKLAPGDEIRLTVEATDDRGVFPGVAAASEPLVLHVTDESGILAALVEADEKTVRELDELIERELAIGGAP